MVEEKEPAVDDIPIMVRAAPRGADQEPHLDRSLTADTLINAHSEKTAKLKPLAVDGFFARAARWTLLVLGIILVCFAIGASAAFVVGYGVVEIDRETVKRVLGALRNVKDLIIR